MPMKVLDRMYERLELSRTDCDDTTLFFELMYLGELVLKTLVVGMIAAMEDDRDRHRYRLEHALVRASGLGDWCNALDDLLTGPASVTVTPAAQIERTELTKACDVRTESTWQASAVASIIEACRILDPDYSTGDNGRVSLRIWLRHFAWLRNKTRGHGATTADTCNRISDPLDKSISLIATNFKLFQREWSFLHRNLSGKYRVMPISDGAASLDYLKRQNDASLLDGIYVVFETMPRFVELMYTDIGFSDFYLCNGGYNGRSFEALSYITDTRKTIEDQRFDSPPSPLPESETEGRGTLDTQGNVFGNLPTRQRDYVERPQLQDSLAKALLNDRHAIITLVGRGGIGKTSLAVEVLHRLANSDQVMDRFFAVLWFSARDVDLTERGPKLVRPRVVSIGDVADQFVELLEPRASREKHFKKNEYLAEQLTKADPGPLLYVFDNFETVREPQAMYDWLDSYIRPPNKILITTRLRDFKGDYPVEVGGMRREEFDKLVAATSRRLGISEMLNDDFCNMLFDQSDGHPYVVKLLLGDLEKEGRLVNITQLVAGKDDVLQALFERTFSQLSPLARRIFLTLCGWRSTVPRLAVEAAVLRVAEEPVDAARAVEELIRSSMIEVPRTPDGDDFLSVPLAAAVFGKKKLTVSTLYSATQADLEFLHMFGAAKNTDVERGLMPRLGQMFRSVARKISADKSDDSLASYRPVLEHIARRHAPAWLLLAALYEEQQTQSGDDLALDSVGHYLEEFPGDLDAWSRLVRLYHRKGDYSGEAQAIVSRAVRPESTFELASEAAFMLSAMHNAGHLSNMPMDERSILFKGLLSRLERDQAEASATDYSRMAWLAIHSKDKEAAADYVRSGLARDPANRHIRKLQKRLIPDEG
jgi:hypothetical protein